MKTCVIVLNWNRPEDTIECLESLLANSGTEAISVICCDNGSDGRSIDTLMSWSRENFSAASAEIDLDNRHGETKMDFTLIRTEANLGYAGGNNTAVRYALERGRFDYLWILNNDTTIEENALTALIECANANPGCVLLGSTLVNYDNLQRLQCAGGFRYYPLTTITKGIMAGKTRQQAMAFQGDVKLSYICGASMFLKVKTIRDVGMFNPDYFLYYEELDFAQRLRRKGYQLGWCKASVVRHKGGLSTGSRSTRNPKGSWIAHYHENLSTLKFTAQHYRHLLPFAATFRLLAKLGLIILLWRWYMLAPTLKAYWDFLAGRQHHDLERASEVKILFTGRYEKGGTHGATSYQQDSPALSAG